MTGPRVGAIDGEQVRQATTGTPLLGGPSGPRASVASAQVKSPDRSSPSVGRTAGGPESPAPEVRDVRLRDVQEGAGPLRLLARVVAAERKEFARKEDGAKRARISGLLSDGTATIRFTWWEPPPTDLERGNVLRVTQPQLRSWQGRPEVSFGHRTKVELVSELELPRLEDREYLARTVAELRSGEEGFRIVVRVLDASSRTRTVGETERVVRSGWMADPTGRIAFTAWTDLGLEAGGAFELFGAYVRTYQGENELVLDERSRAVPLPSERVPGVKGPEEEAPVEIAALEERGGGRYQVVEGVVVEVRAPSGLVASCPLCDRALSQGRCRQDGSVRGEMDLRARLVLDDGTATLTAQLARPQLEALLGLTREQAVDLARERLDPTVVLEEIRRKLLLRRLRFLGRAVPGDWGLTLFVDRSLPVDEGADGAGRATPRGSP